MDIVSQLYILLDVAIAMGLSGLIGFEREISSKPAGFRTNMIVGGAACLLLSLGLFIVEFLFDKNYGEFLQLDPLRIIEAIVVGISFIGAGTILKSSENEKVNFLTTAATILFSASVGICVALDLYMIGIGATLLILLVNTVMKKVDSKIGSEE